MQASIKVKSQKSNDSKVKAKATKKVSDELLDEQIGMKHQYQKI